MKQRVKRSLAMLLSLAMILTLLPMTALTALADEGSGGLPDGALADTWYQDEDTKVSGSVEPEITEDGKLKLTAVAGNANNCDGSTPPAFFRNEQLDAAIAAAGEGERELSFDMIPNSTATNICLGFGLNYTDRNHEVFIGYNTIGKWFVQYYGGTGAYPYFTGPALEKGQTYHITIKWTDEKITLFQVDDTVCELPNEGDFQGVAVADAFGFKCGRDTAGDGGNGITSMEISNLHYTGQKAGEVVPATYTVSGTVTDGADPIEGATVVLGDKSAATGADGAYRFTRVEEGAYAVSVTAKGFEDADATVTVEGADVTRDFTLTRKTVQTLPDDGVTNDEWVQDEQTVVGGETVEKTANGVHLKSVSGNGNSHNATPGTGDGGAWPAVFMNKTANEALANAKGNRWIEFTYVRAEGSNERFGVILNYVDPSDGFFIGCNNASGWFYENYTGGGYSGSTGGTPAAGVETTVRVEWNDTTMVSFQVNGSTIYSNLPMTANEGTGVGFRMNTWSNSHSEVYIKEMHYSGQEEMVVYNVSGTVRDDSGNALEGATVSADQYTTTTGASGAYSLTLPADATYAITASKDGYADGTTTVTVDGAVSGKDITLKLLPKVSGKVVDTEGYAVVGAAVTLKKDGQTFKTGATGSDGTYEIVGVPNGDYTVVVSCDGYEEYASEELLTVNGNSSFNATLSLKEIESEILSNGAMDVQVAVNFPQVIQYVLENGKTMYGQTSELDTLNLNGVAVKPAVVSEKSEDGKTMTYTMTVDETNNNGTNLNVVITARLVVGIDGGENTLGFYIDRVEYTKDDRLDNPLQTIEVPNHSLVSVRSTEADSVGFTGGKRGGGTYTNGDETYQVSASKGTNMGLSWTSNYFAGFVYNDELSAGLASNSEYGSGVGGSNNYPVRLTFEPKNNGAVESLALSSTMWYWDRKVSSVNSGTWENSYIDKAHSVMGPEANELPFAKVSIADGDQNGDGKIDWQDGAIVYRDTVMHKPANSEGVRDAVSMRISMNFGGQAANPFLLALDNVKRVALSTDGLGQLILLKGYASEGHDSGHPDYWNIGERMGGVDDFNTMLEEGAKLGAQFGIHVNASEFYPEAKAFNDMTVGRDSAGNLRYGWNWIDQGINMNVLYDMASGNREERFAKLYELVGSRLTFVYVDVWGNNQHGVGEDAWMTRKLTNEIVNNTGWRIAHEWSYANPYDSTFQHWTSDYTYGGAGYKGDHNSNVMRFLLNSYKDSFPADFATYGGACNAPLLGGPSMQGFEGWQKDDEYDLTIANTFNQLVATKFLQHYDIMQWINADNEVAIPHNPSANQARNQTGNWRPEMQIVLQDEAGNKVVVTRGLDDKLDTTASFSLDNEVEYRSRVITLNGKVILRGAPASAGEDKAFTAATQQYLIPWFWDADGSLFADDDVKLFHWNALGGDSAWELPDGWEDLSTVILYELSDQGRVNPVTVNVVNGWVTLSGVKANTGYVVVKGEASKGPQFDWSTGLHVQDASFNVDFPNSYWNTTGTVERVNNPGGISVVHLNGDASVSQVMTDLKAGQKYATYVAVDNLAGRAVITIADEDGNVLASNYTDESIAINYVSSYHLHTAAGLDTTGGFRNNRESRFQNMYVFFTPEAGKTYTMTLSHEGSGDAYFDDVRTLETEADNFEYDADGNVVKFTQDFEHVAQGMYPFVVAGIEGVEDNRQHLSELHAPYTQAGWDKKLMDDVLEGNWSVKVNGLVQRNTLVMQTIPQNFRFEPGETYFVSFKYQMGSAGIYQVVIGDGQYTGLNGLKVIQLEQGMGRDKDNTCSFIIKGSESGQTWFGIYSTGVAPTSSDSFTGEKEIVLDDLVIERSFVNRDALNKAVDAASAMDLADYVVAEGVEETDEAVFAEFESALANAQSIQLNPEATQEDVDAATKALNDVIAKLVKVEITISGVVTGVDGKPVADATVILEDAAYIPTGLTAVTDENGAFRFESTDEVELRVLAYKLKVVAAGYDVDTANVTLSKAAPDAVEEIALVAEAPGAYVNNFDNGDVSMMQPFDDHETLGDNKPTIFGTFHNSSNAVCVRFSAWTDATLQGRMVNNMVDKSIKIANGTVSFDITPMTAAEYLGITLRGLDGSTRVYIGQESGPNRWIAEWWKDGKTGYTAVTNTPIAMEPGITRRVSVTMDGSTYTVKLDGIQIFQTTLPGDAPVEAGYVGINMRFTWSSANPGDLGNYATDYVVDNIRIVSTDEPAENTYTIEGTVFDGTGAGFAGASVTVLNAEGERVTSTTANAEGLYKTQALEPGTYTVKFTAPNCAEVTKEVVISDADVTGIDAVLIHIHSLTHVEAVEPTTEAEGNIEYWYCASCGKYFSDADATVEIAQEDTVLARLSVIPIVPEIVIPAEPGPDEEVEDPDTPLADLPFIDVAKDAWYAQSVANIYAKGYMKGTGELTFDPKLALNRGMMAQIIHNMAENPSAGADAAFTDLNDKYYTEAVAWGAANGVLKGYSEDLFGGEDNVTREQMVVMLYRYAQSLDLCQDVDRSVLDGYADGARVSGWAKEAVAWAVENGLIQGRGNNDLDPRANITRAEVAAVLDRFSKLFLA